MARKKRPLGRKSRLTPELKEKLCALVRAGGNLTQACAATGIADSTVFYWLQLANDGEVDGIPAQPRHLDLLDGIKKARAEFELRAVNQISKVGHGQVVVRKRTITKPDGTVIVEEDMGQPQWTALAWLLERTNRREYGPVMPRQDDELDQSANLPDLVINSPAQPRQIEAPASNDQSELRTGADTEQSEAK